MNKIAILVFCLCLFFAKLDMLYSTPNRYAALYERAKKEYTQENQLLPKTSFLRNMSDESFARLVERGNRFIIIESFPDHYQFGASVAIVCDKDISKNDEVSSIFPLESEAFEWLYKYTSNVIESTSVLDVPAITHKVTEFPTMHTYLFIFDGKTYTGCMIEDSRQIFQKDFKFDYFSIGCKNAQAVFSIKVLYYYCKMIYLTTVTDLINRK